MRDSFWKQTKSEKVGSVDGLNLFFGALLGANLGTLDRLPIGDYIHLIILLACTVGVLRMVSTSHRRVYALVTLAIYAALVATHLFSETSRPEALSINDTQRLGATLAIWAVTVLLIEFSPTQKEASGEDEPANNSPGPTGQA